MGFLGADGNVALHKGKLSRLLLAKGWDVTGWGPELVGWDRGNRKFKGK